MPSCPRCTSDSVRKHGRLLERQRYFCRECHFAFTRLTPRGVDKEKKRLAVEMYLEGLGFRSIARILKVSHVAILKWMKELAEKLGSVIGSEKEVKMMELDEMWGYVKKKSTSAGSGWLLIERPANQSLGSAVLVVSQQEKGSGRKSKTSSVRSTAQMTG